RDLKKAHRARVGDKRDVLKVQSPGVENLMMIYIINLQIFALYISICRLGMNSVEANAMEKLRRFLWI
ncbi:predicted protein, partial [Arabidopsis lyrata subsp. lyrata]